MEPDHTDTMDGTLTTFDGRFLSRQQLQLAGERVTRLLVSDSSDSTHSSDRSDGTHSSDSSDSSDPSDPSDPSDSETVHDGPVAVLVGEEHRGELPGLRTGRRYRLSELRWCVPPAALDRAADRLDDATDCPTCGGTLRVAGSFDGLPDALRAAAAALELTDPFAFFTDASTVRATTAELVDDWQFDDDHEPVAHRHAYVCLDCDRRFHPHEVSGGPADQSGGSHEVDFLPADHDGVHFERMAPQTTTLVADASRCAETLGLTTGGANDASNFRENVHNGYTPQPDALTTTGLFGDYRFPTDGVQGGATDTLFAPTYATAVSDDPVTGDRERYLAVGLDSTLSVADFERPRLDLVAVLDVSGSMDAAFDEYYYDEHGRRREAADRDGSSKLDAAAESLCSLTEQLRPDDRFAVVLFNDRARVAKPLRDVASTDIAAIRGHIRDVQAGGGTNVAAGFDAARDLLERSASSDREGVERRVVFLTDAMPNTGVTGTPDLADRFADAADHGIHATFVGMGLDANADLVDDLSAIRGANHVFVHSAAEFDRRLGDEFDYMVTPLVYDLALDVVADGYEIAAVHGSPNADAATGAVMHTATLFPTPKRDGETRGGVILVELERIDDERIDDERIDDERSDDERSDDERSDDERIDDERSDDERSDDERIDDQALALDASWTERDGTDGRARVTVEFPDDADTDADADVDAAPHYDHDGVRKAVALTRYARLLRDWATAVRHGVRPGAAVGDGDDRVVDDWRGSGPRQTRSEHERGSVPLAVPQAFVDDVVTLRASLATELEALGDETLSQELAVLDALLDAADVDRSTIEQEGAE